MRRVTLTAFFFLAACGGGVSNPSSGAIDRSSAMREAQAFLLSADARAVIAAFAKVSSQSDLDTCLAAYVDDFGGPSDMKEPIQKPDVSGLRNFLAQCLGRSVEGDQRAAPDKLRATRTTDMRGVLDHALRIDSDKDVRTSRSNASLRTTGTGAGL